ncbi:hypothetical protein NM134_2029 [Neisseria meningitidis NM134]|nr:hypothetical protein NM134_2029 [Neisseria meningitidis NM134]
MTDFRFLISVFCFKGMTDFGFLFRFSILQEWQNFRLRALLSISIFYLPYLFPPLEVGFFLDRHAVHLFDQLFRLFLVLAADDFGNLVFELCDIAV